MDLSKRSSVKTAQIGNRKWVITDCSHEVVDDVDYTCHTLCLISQETWQRPVKTSTQCPFNEINTNTKNMTSLLTGKLAQIRPSCLSIQIDKVAHSVIVTCFLSAHSIVPRKTSLHYPILWHATKIFNAMALSLFHYFLQVVKWRKENFRSIVLLWNLLS